MNCPSMVPPQDAVLQEHTAPEWVLHEVPGPASKPAQCELLSPWGHRSCQDPAPAWASHRITAPFRLCGVLHRLQLDLCSPMDLHRLEGHILPHHGLHHRLQGNLCSGAWSVSCPSFCTDLSVSRAVCLTYSPSSFTVAMSQH